MDEGIADFNFYINKAYWRRWGPAAAKPFRVVNLLDVQKTLHNFGISSSLYGQSLADAWFEGRLEEDHDDDIMVGADLDVLSDGPLRALESMGFEIIRGGPNMISILRFDRYIDIHPLRHRSEGYTELKVDGYLFSIFSNTQTVLNEKYGQNTLNPRWRRSESKGLRYFAERNLLMSGQSARWIIRKTAGALESSGLKRKKADERYLLLDEFLRLKIDADGATNWTWRKLHMDPLYKEGESLGDAVARLSIAGLGDPGTYKATPLSQCVSEPVNLSRDFWWSGNAFFAYPFIFGFRHCVLPYQAANLYIRAGLKPELYSSQYFQELPAMNDFEIERLLSQSPISVQKGAVRSGRHRVTAMLGRVMRGERYIPILARFD